MPTSSGQHPWVDALRVYLRLPVLAMLFLGFSAGLPFLLVFSTLTTWLRTSGVEVAAIGFFSWIGLLYSIKFFWAPVVDAFRLPLLTRLLGQRRSWMLAGQALIMGGLLGLSSLDPASQLGAVALFALMVAFGSATQDIAIDAFRIESAEDEVQAAMASTYIIGYRGGLIMAGAGALYLASAFSWQVSYQCMAALTAVGMITVLLRPEPPRQPLASRLAKEPRVRAFLRASRGRPAWVRRTGAWLIGSVVCPFLDFFARFGLGALGLLLFIGIYRISDLAMASMAYPLYVDLGFSLDTIATVTKVFGVIMSLLGGLVGGVLVVRYGIGRILVLGATATVLTNLMFAWLALSGAQHSLLVLTIVGDNLSNGLASAVFIAFLSSLTSRAYTATQYALFSSLMTLPGKFLSGFGGLVVEGMGYPSFFVLASALGVPAILMALWVWRHHVREPGDHSVSLDKP